MKPKPNTDKEIELINHAIERISADLGRFQKTCAKHRSPVKSLTLRVKQGVTEIRVRFQPRQ